ncbi:MAG: 3-hydroxyanthranilate 3,4-dioxygenase [Candidatus Sericytochromatia bacterium]|uniref:3-hydroxyanthranilate 3,4-dioxygenase n=1 Tax=Candidatus Tanganyikabacteria bacterium TaxID=2961651 RepID=A0A937X3Y1_9BACT|nr:3-hydroxyanthranilate 3,4-dioxygenase [Candidatus Tanganyikabacteria bacterium]
MALSTLNLKVWIDEHRHLLKPPVGNAQIWKDADFIVMVVGGPNSRKDYHVDPSEEFFYQLEGDMVLKIVEDGKFRDVPIREGEILLLPPGVPHSPQRFPDTVGLVIERARPAQTDAFQWYCESCGKLLHEVTLVVTDITTQLKPLFEAFWADEAARTCGACGAILSKPGLATATAADTATATGR